MKQVAPTLALLLGLTVFFPWVAPASPGYSLYNPAWGGPALQDELFTPLINPAALAQGKASGFGFALPLNENDAPGQKDFGEEYHLLLNASFGGYALGYQDSTFTHLISGALPLGPYLSLGYSWSWEESSFTDGHYQAGMLLRPGKALSLGAVYRDLPDDPLLEAGLGFRPLWFNDHWGTRLTLDGNIRWIPDQSDFDVSTASITVEVLDGLRLSAGYDHQEETLSLGARFNLRQSETGTSAAVKNSGKELSNSMGYGFFRATRRHTVLERRGSEVIEYDRTGTITSHPRVHRFSQPHLPLETLINDLERFRDDPSVGAILVNGTYLQAPLAYVSELLEAFNRLRLQGTQIFFYFDWADPVAYLLAAAVSDQVFFHPTAVLDLRGFAYSGVYLGQFLQNYGIQIYNYRSHEHKTAGDSLSEAAMTEAEREGWEILLEDLADMYNELLAAARKPHLPKDAEEIVADGPYLTAQGALEAGLIDGILYPDQLQETIFLAAPGTERWRKPDRTRRPPLAWGPEGGALIQVIHGVGPIIPGEAIAGESIGGESFSRAIREARENPFVQGIILRIETGGGAITASDQIAREVSLARAAGKPVVVSMGSIAASGGYYISAPASHIVANPATITGSIGVVAIQADMEALLERFAIGTGTVRTAPKADFGSILRAPSPEEQDLWRAYIDDGYQRFIDIVADSRPLSREEVHQVAQGKVWTGRQALDQGLVDSLGGLSQAERVMAQLLDSSLPLRSIHTVPGNTRFDLNQALGVAGGGGSSSLGRNSLAGLSPARIPPVRLGPGRPLSRELAETLAELQLLAALEGAPLYLMPYGVPGVTSPR
ncbi:protease-4 [Alkalispirochaeta americana]|uniref:Protease-4 n=1 Tax=Alkalispirochaeta americana TaxID=159291 RepID=A0A1N6T3I6_9SPIO|nr:signal peptide peptidase SppA [Alkalispirochaeta americana]SIQ47890.1 protease-4 [Alkalispirochaeta americana]